MLVNYSSQYRIHILTLAGDRLASFSPEPEPALGIREVAWHPTGMFLAVAGWDDKVYQQTFSWSRLNDQLSRFTFSTVSAGRRSSPLSFQAKYLLRWSVSLEMLINSMLIQALDDLAGTFEMVGSNRGQRILVMYVSA